MQYEVSFGTLSAPPRPIGAQAKFRLLVMGDFSGRANAGQLETGEDLARRKPLRVDVDNLDDVLVRMKIELSLALAEDEAVVQVPIGSLDDFHPDQLAENVELFESLVQLRRDLGSKAGYARASKEVLSWTGEKPLPRARKRARGAAVATDRKLSDFARLTGRPSAAAEASPVDELLRRLVGPYVEPARDAQQPALIARVDHAMSVAMRRVLHHPDFQTAEALWRSMDLLVRRVETDGRTQIVMLDISAEEVAADLAASDALEETGLYKLLVELPRMDADAGAYSAIVGLYNFELTPPHADLLGRIAKLAAVAGAPFLAAIEPDLLQEKWDNQHPLIREAWSALWALPEAAYVGLLTPRFLLRMPYGKASDPIDAFAFEEFTRESGLSGMLWGNPALIGGLLLAQAWTKSGTKMKPGSVGSVGEIPYYVYTAPDGDKVALPCTERLYSERQAAQVVSHHVMPVTTLRGRPEVRLAQFRGLTGDTLAGFWAPLGAAAAVEEEPVAEAEESSGDNETEASAEPSGEDGDGEGAPPDESAHQDNNSSGEDLDALLASLSDDKPAEAEEGSNEVDLDALLASL